jgi:hypothetical protein
MLVLLKYNFISVSFNPPFTCVYTTIVRQNLFKIPLEIGSEHQH